MAINRIKVNTGMLNNTISDMNIDNSQIERYINDLYNTVAELDSMWDGSANAAFNQQFEIDRAELIRISREIDKFIESLKDAKQEYEKCENKVADIVNSIRI